MQNRLAVKRINQIVNENKVTSSVRHKRIHRADLLAALLSLVVIIPLIFTSGVIIYFQTHQLNLPGVYIYDQDVGMRSLTETATRLDLLWNQSRQIVLSIPGDPQASYFLTPKDLGLWVDSGKTALTAYHIGRAEYPFKDVLAALKGERQLVMPILFYDETVARRTLTAIQVEQTTFPQDARLEYQDGTWAAIPGTQGQTLDIEATLADLYTNAFNILLNGSLDLYPKALTPEVTDLSPVLDDISQIASQEFRFRAYDPITDEHLEWQVPVEMKKDWVTMDPESYEVGLAINPTDVENLIQDWEASLGESRSFENTPKAESVIKKWDNGGSPQVIIYHAPTTYTVGPGESLWAISLKLGMPMWHILDANEGLTVDNIAAGMVLTIPSKNILLPLPVIPEKRIVIDIGDQTMTVYENGQVRNQYIVSTGMSNSPTMPGIFQVQSHEINAYASNWDLWMPHFLGIYEAWPGFMNGIHGLPLLSGGGRLWASSLGSPASYGCIILDLGAAEDLYFWAEDGVVVEINR